VLPVIDHPGARRLAAAWTALAASALGASALYALLLVLSRTPGAGGVFPGHDFFYPALVLHVNLSALIWFLAFAGALWSAALAARSLAAGWLAFWLSAAGSALVVVSPFAEGGGALVSNYIPVLDNAVFHAGLALFGAGGLVSALRALWAARDPAPALRAGLAAAAVAVLAAALSLAWSEAALPDFLPAAAHFEALFWGPGHTLQFAHTLLMMCAWLALARELPGAIAPGARASRALFLLALLPLAAVPAIHALYPPAGPDFRQAFTALMSWGTWIGAAPLGLLLAWRLLGAGELDESGRGLRLALLLSVLLFLFGLGTGALIRHDNAMVPAHYHGVIGAVTLAFMALGFRLLEALGWTAPGARAARRQAALYGGGTLAMAAGLAWAGGHGVARKATGAQQLLDGLPEVAAMAVMGVGGLVAVAGGVLFVGLVFRALTQRRAATASSSGAQTDRRPFALAFVLGMILVTGSLVSVLPGSGSGRPVLVEKPPADPRRDPAGHARERRRAEIRVRFEQAVLMLHAKQYEHAATALHRVLELDPGIPEAHANMGFAMIGLQRYAVARDFFLSATELQPMQANAYYGLAEALEALGDIPGALGAMRTYLHLAPADDAFRRKAQSAIWEWESGLAAPGKSSGPSPS
jgi:cytochrome c oxidase subunit 1